ncbi:hypothetical protein GCM10011518_36480 [Flavobacterium limi]|uniref:Uncharacterized protein n=1 Tax=Flavobacterium limi TaxID=2045105 RepID=A0ABQ1UR54_9FLAO|nr:hypothetical protein GCM10011518_36480 [Flavobacterium limi]
MFLSISSQVDIAFPKSLLVWAEIGKLLWIKELVNSLSAGADIENGVRGGTSFCNLLFNERVCFLWSVIVSFTWA